MIDRIKEDLHSLLAHKPHRLQHVLGVRDTAIELGKKYNLDLEKLELAALLHDMTKYMTYEEHVTAITRYYQNAQAIISQYNPQILHAFSAVVHAVETYQITDNDILKAIESHTVGRPDMSKYEEVIFISDYIEPNRTYDSCKKARGLVEESLELAIYHAINDSITFFEEKGDDIPLAAYQARTYYQSRLEELHGKN